MDRPILGKDIFKDKQLGLVFSHVFTQDNNYFIMPPGYSVVFLSKTGLSVNDEQLKRESHFEGYLAPSERNLTLESRETYKHEYLPGELLQDNYLSFTPESISDNATKKYLILTGIIAKNSYLKPDELNAIEIKPDTDRNIRYRFDKGAIKPGCQYRIEHILRDNKILLSTLLTRYLIPGRYIVYVCRTGAAESLPRHIANERPERMKSTGGNNETTVPILSQFYLKYAHYIIERLGLNIINSTKPDSLKEYNDIEHYFYEYYKAGGLILLSSYIFNQISGDKDYYNYIKDFESDPKFENIAEVTEKSEKAIRSLQQYPIPTGYVEPERELAPFPKPPTHTTVTVIGENPAEAFMTKHASVGGGKSASKKKTNTLFGKKKGTNRKKRKETNRKNRKGECVIWVRKKTRQKDKTSFTFEN